MFLRRGIGLIRNYPLATALAVSILFILLLGGAGILGALVVLTEGLTRRQARKFPKGPPPGGRPMMGNPPLLPAALSHRISRLDRLGRRCRRISQ